MQWIWMPINYDWLNVIQHIICKRLTTSHWKVSYQCHFLNITNTCKCTPIAYNTKMYNTLQHTTMHCTTRCNIPQCIVQHVATYHNALYNTLQHTTMHCTTHCNIPQCIVQHIATYHNALYNTLQHTTMHCTTHCNIPQCIVQHIATYHNALYNTLQHTTMHCTTHCNIPQCIVVCCNVLYNTLQHTTMHCTTHCNIPQYIVQHTTTYHNALGNTMHWVIHVPLACARSCPYTTWRVHLLAVHTSVRALSCRQCVVCAMCTWYGYNSGSQPISMCRDWIDLHSCYFIIFSLAVRLWICSLCCIFMIFFLGGLMFHCSFTGARLWRRSTFLLGLGKGISESLFGALAVRYGFSVMWISGHAW